MVRPWAFPISNHRAKLGVTFCEGPLLAWIEKQATRNPPDFCSPILRQTLNWNRTCQDDSVLHVNKPGDFGDAGKNASATNGDCIFVLVLLRTLRLKPPLKPWLGAYNYLRLPKDCHPNWINHSLNTG